MKNKAFIFDWSGTLSDNFYLFSRVCTDMFRELGRKPISDDEIKQYFTMPYMKFWNRYFPDMSRDEQNKLYDKYSNFYYKKIEAAGALKLFKNVKNVLQYLKQQDYQLFILSSDPYSTLIPEIDKDGIKDYFKKIIGEVHIKEDDIISLVNEFNLDKKSTFYVGDTSGDVVAGKMAKIKTIGFTGGYQHKRLVAASHPDYLINDIIEIKNIIDPGCN